jgi:hypothetical protein
LCFAACSQNQANVFAADSGGDAAVLQADRALQDALQQKDAPAADTLLDPRFTWTNEKGQTLTRAQFLRDSASGRSASATDYADLKGRDYGQLAIVTGVGKHTGRADTFFARVWVKEPAGWLLLTHQDTPLVAKRATSAPAASSTPASAAASSDCDNPCRMLPVAPKTEAEKAVFKAYQAVETAVTSHDAKTWADHVADEFVGIGRNYAGSPDTKAGRVGQIGIVTNHVVLPTMIRGKAFVFGDSAIIIADHQPVGEPPYHVIRVWVNRDGRWQLFHRQETTIVNGKAAD